MTSIRSRWAAIGAAVAVTLGAGGVSLGQAAIGSGDKPVFVAIEPCRLVDTRPGDANIGGRTAPLSAGDTLTLQVTGSTGKCSSIPAGATAAAMNVTAIQGSTRSYLTLYPADADLPLASNLNWNGGDPPTPNKVDVALATTGPDTGAVKITNNAGTVHVAADLVGYYTDHHHDDRYYTEAEVDGALAAKAAVSDVYERGEIDTALATKADIADVYTKDQVDARQAAAWGNLNAFFPTNLTNMTGVSSVVENVALKRYEITLTGVSYSIDDTTVLTLNGDYGNCPANTAIRESSVGGMLLVYVLTEAGDFAGNCSFDFVSYAD